MLVDTFVDALRVLVRDATVDAVLEAVKSGAAPAGRASTPAATNKTPGADSAPAVNAPQRPGPAAGVSPASRPRRTSELLDQLMARVHSHIKADRGQGAGQIAVAMGISSAELTYVFRKLLGAKKITSKGQKRDTRYFPR